MADKVQDLISGLPEEKIGKCVCVCVELEEQAGMWWIAQRGDWGAKDLCFWDVFDVANLRVIVK